MVVSWISRAVHSLVMAAKYNVVFVLGGPGAGKGTQCAKIVEVRSRNNRRLSYNSGWHVCAVEAA